MKHSRRVFLQGAGSITAGIALGVLPLAVRAAPGDKVKIGIIGSGRIGGTLGGIWVKTGHEVMFSSLDLEQDKALAAKLGSGARAGTTREAVAFGEVHPPRRALERFPGARQGDRARDEGQDRDRCVQPDRGPRR